MIFQGRKEASELLAKKLGQCKNKKSALVLAIPRGGVETGYYLAKSLKLRLDIIITKKIGAPENPELAIGAVGPGKTVYLNQEIIELYGISKGYIEKESAKIEKTIKGKYRLFSGNRKPPEIKNKTIILTDDGVATGATILVAAIYIKKQKPKKLIIAVPVCLEEVLGQLKEIADDVFCLSTDLVMGAVGACYRNFHQLTDEEVIGYLKLLDKQ